MGGGAGTLTTGPRSNGPRNGAVRTRRRVQVKKKQTHVESLLQAKKIPYQTRDIATNEQFRTFMRNKSGQTMPPQIFRDDDYLGVRGPRRLPTPEGPVALTRPLPSHARRRHRAPVPRPRSLGRPNRTLRPSRTPSSRKSSTSSWACEGERRA